MLIGTPRPDTLTGMGGNDTIIGKQSGDRLSGQDGNDYIRGGSGKDRISGDAGDDTLIGGREKDRMSGGEGDDTFIFSDKSEIDVIRDFEQGSDLLDVSRLGGINGLGDLTITEEARGTRITTDGDVEIFLRGFDGTLTNADFLF